MTSLPCGTETTVRGERLRHDIKNNDAGGAERFLKKTLILQSCSTDRFVNNKKDHPLSAA